MVQAVTITAADTAAHNLYELILDALGVTQLPQRADLGDVIFQDPVASVNFYVASGTLSVQDQDGNQITLVPATTDISLGTGDVNNISLQAMKIQSGSGCQVISLSVFVV